MPRTGSVRDELGSALIGSRLVRDIMHLCFLLEKRYAPYPKWLGTAFQQLALAGELSPLLWRAQQAPRWDERAETLAHAYEIVARKHNALGISRALLTTVSPFYDRPFPVIHGEHFAQALVEQITDPELQRIAQQGLIGSISQWSDTIDMETVERKKRRLLYLPSKRFSPP